MKLSLAAVLLLATGIAAAAIPRDVTPNLEVRDLASRATYTVNVSELDSRIRQLEHERAALLSIGETAAANRKGYEIEKLKTQLAQYDSYASTEAEHANRWARSEARATVIDVAELHARITQLEHEVNVLLSVGENAAANRKWQEVEALKAQLAGYQSTESNNAGVWGAIGKRNIKRQSTATTFAEVQNEIAELIEEIIALQAAGDTEEAARLHRELDQLRAMGDSYADAERGSVRGRK